MLANKGLQLLLLACVLLNEHLEHLFQLQEKSVVTSDAKTP